jgi:hypothetical protein
MGLYLIYRHGSDIYLWGLVGASWLVALQMIGTVDPYAPARTLLSPTQIAMVEAALVTLFYLVLAAVATRRLAVISGWLRRRFAATHTSTYLRKSPGSTPSRPDPVPAAPAPETAPAPAPAMATAGPVPAQAASRTSPIDGPTLALSTITPSSTD